MARSAEVFSQRNKLRERPLGENDSDKRNGDRKNGGAQIWRTTRGKTKALLGYQPATDLNYRGSKDCIVRQSV